MIGIVSEIDIVNLAFDGNASHIISTCKLNHAHKWLTTVGSDVIKFIPFK